MGDQSQDLHDALQSSLSWSRDEKSIFLDMLVEEFINKQPEAMDALVALVLFRISKITDEGWNQVAIRFTEHTGKTYTMEELKEQMKRFTQPIQYMENLFGQGGPGIHFPHSTFEPCSERKEDTRVFKSPDENVPIHEKDAINSDGCNVGVQYHEACVRKSNRSSEEGDHGMHFPDHGMHFPRTTSKQFFECGNDGDISMSPDGECEGAEVSTLAAEINCGNSSNIEQSDKEGGPGTSFPLTEFQPSDGHDSDAGICQSPVESVSIPEKDSSNPEGCNDSVSVIYPEESITNSSRSCNDVLHPQDVEDSGVNPSDSYPRKYDNAEENVKDSGVHQDKYHTRESENATEKARESKGSPSCTLDGEKDCRNLSICRNVSSPMVNAEFVSNSYDSASDQEDNVISSTPRYEDYNTNKSMLCNMRPAADPLDSSDYKINKWSSYSKAENFCLVDENPDDGDSFSFARCRNILHGMRRIDSQFRDTALDFLEDPYYRKFFMQIKYEKRLDWLSSILGIKY
ncbi:hypothetical protein LIER_21737 [Lithospermum erythrorhizon]|uniref:Uncharacterized protein n=1 Tax=Lithospermum erythrorhizon TaxID=34254 RepID=A0AAV3QRG4_LITER